MRTFFMDESGYTGHDLWSMQQPFQGAAALSLDEALAADLVKEHFPDTQLSELKHQKLSRRKGYWPALLNLQSRLLKEHQCYSYVCDKRYLLTLMFLDYCVEPAFYVRGINFFEDGHNYDLASAIYYTAPTIWGKSEFSDLLYLFQRALRTKSELIIEALVQKAISLRGHEFSEYLSPLANRDEACLNEIRTSPIDTDAAYVVISSLISHIEKFADEQYQVVHDRSENLLRYNTLINKMIAMKQEVEFRATAITTLKFPLRLARVLQADSKDHIGIQLADVLIGGIVEHAAAVTGLIEKNDYNANISALYPDTSLIHLLPNLNFEESTQFRKGNNAAEMIEFFSKHFG